MQIHIAKSGESVSSISKKYSADAELIAYANQIDPNRYLKAGQVIVVPISGMFYTARPSDSLESLARLFDISPKKLARANKIPPGGIVSPGARFYIPPVKNNIT